MISTIDALAAGGILRPADVAAIAARAGLDLAAAATLLQMESGGGRHVWGHDGVPTGGAYVKGDPVTEESYRAYLAAVKAGKASRQGVGPTQLTWSGYQALADSRGGCWRWEVNAAVGFEVLAGHIREHGEHDGFRAYNGTGPAAQAYADRAMARLVEWRGKLGSTRPTIAQGARGPAVQELQRLLGITADGAFGPDTARAVRAFQSAHGLVADGIVGPATWRALRAVAA